MASKKNGGFFSELAAAILSGYWIEEEHLWGNKTYKCSVCGRRFQKPTAACPGCKARMKRKKPDPVWVEEMGDYDME